MQHLHVQPSQRSALITIVFLSCCILYPITSYAHDIGLNEVKLHEKPDFTYILTLEGPSFRVQKISAPVLPPQCVVCNDSNTGDRLFTFKCSQRFTPDDIITLNWPFDAILVKAHWNTGEQTEALILPRDKGFFVDLSRILPLPNSTLNKAQYFLEFGFTHIFTGIDHLLFVTTLLLLLRHYTALLKAITAFSVGHSVSLATSYLGFVNLKSNVVEACIAFSIVILALEVLQARANRKSLTIKYPWLVAIGFGLFHGLGFAGALRELAIPQSSVPIALLFFNLGVELGQILFISIIMLATSTLGLFIHWLVRRSLPQKNRSFTVFVDRRNRPHELASTSTDIKNSIDNKMATLSAYIIGCIAMTWTFERTYILFFSIP